MSRKINLIFPIAGQGVRFGDDKFKPFLEIGDITFIETAFNSFSNYKHLIDKVVFICTEEQEKKFNVEATLKEIINHPSVVVVKIPKTTSGPYQTVRSALRTHRELKAPNTVSIICDCDHELDVTPIFNEIEKGGAFDVIIPCWKITRGEQKNWSKVVSSKGKIRGFVEKDIIKDKTLEIRGIIGCIAFNNIGGIFTSSKSVYVSEALQELFKRHKKIKTVDIQDANFFGDPIMLDTYVNTLRKRATIFCDIDGVLVKHKPHSDVGPDNVVLPGIDKLHAWKKDKHRIVLTTARSEKSRKDLMAYLDRHAIPYDDLVMSLPPGQRFLINDRKPSKHFTRQSIAIELPRDRGLSDVDIDGHIETKDIAILAKLEGNSFANTHLIDLNSEKFVRKHIVKEKSAIVHYHKLKRQYNDLIRLNFIMNDLTPKIYSEIENDYEYSFDMEYLDDYKKLSDVPEVKQVEALRLLLPKLSTEVYSLKKSVSDAKWIDHFLDRKIYPKLNAYAEDSMMNTLIFSDVVTINSKKYRGLWNILETLKLGEFNPDFISPIHGDLTFENALYNEKTHDLKLIDMDGSDHFDTPALDLGKLFQSCIANYSGWKNIPSPITFESKDEIRCVEGFFDVIQTPVNKELIAQWSLILNKPEDDIMRTGIFYMCTFFIRFIPFRQQISRDHGLFALILSIVWLNKLLKI